MATVTSSLWVVYSLTTQSSYFPHLVEAACVTVGVPYSREVMVHAAAWPAVRDTISVEIKDGVPASADVVLERLIVENGAAVDSVIVDAVSAYADAHPTPTGGS